MGMPPLSDNKCIFLSYWLKMTYFEDVGMFTPVCTPISVCGAYMCARNTFAMHTSACRGLNVTSGVFLDCPLFCLLRQSLLQGLEFTNSRLLLLLKLFLTLITELQVAATSVQLFSHDLGEAKFNPHA